jgi:hypothetical protein
MSSHRWHTSIGAGLAGRIVALQGLARSHGTITIEWDGGQCSMHLPQSLLRREPHWLHAQNPTE